MRHAGDHAKPGGGSLNRVMTRLRRRSTLDRGRRLRGSRRRFRMDELYQGDPRGPAARQELAPLGGGGKMKVLICDDHTLFNEGFRFLLEGLDPRTRATLVTSAPEAEAAVRATPFDLIFLDWNLGHSPTGGDAMALIREAAPDTRIVVLSGETRESEILNALELGAAGFIPKATRTAEFNAALTRILSGQLYIPSGLHWPSAAAAGASLSPTAPPTDVASAFPELTARQADVFKVVLRGSADKLIARELGISPNTVKTHLKTIYAELGVGSRGEAVYLATRRGVRIA
jgi:two-component system nitrate/nitrite response regulator NarL